ncbi:MAG: bifunctional 2-C-methyl-D-erythritol 4-phosphate cytidylyltransferase/2-C-methyl-D-erythritol 2,4-cyclodiphosphate synthase [Alteraurantiacibacter sp.]
MDQPSALPTNALAAVIVAAGQGLRAGQPLPKQFAPYRQSTVLREAVQNLFDAAVDLICVVIPAGSDALVSELLAGLSNCVILTTGGATRQDSVLRGLEALAPHDPSVVLIHDAARPNCPAAVVERLVDALRDAPGSIPVLPVIDSIVHTADDRMGAPADRSTLRRVQTPQCFRYAAILAAHRQWQGPTHAGDDAQVAQAAGLAVALVEGDERLRKLTFAGDFIEEKAPMIRTGTGYDVHRLAKGEELWLCGLPIPHDMGLAGHSDADVALHALVDAILGAVGEGDIGLFFPPSDPQWRGARSSLFVLHAVQRAASKGYRIGNVDVTIICEAPKIGPHREAMRAELARLLGVQAGCVNVKATTSERLGFTGRGEGIAAQAVCTLVAI